jgi:hypothetical protein
MSKQQTAVEWFDDKIIGLNVEFDMNLISRTTYWVRRNEILEQANKMFEQQIIDAFWMGDNSDCTSEQNSKEFAEQYYNQTFNK